MSEIPDSTVERLPIYLRVLTEAREAGVKVMGSPEIASPAGTNAAQVRKDLSYLGELGVRGVGYDVGALAEHITRILGLSARRKVAVIGAGRLGTALVSYFSMIDRGFVVVSLFDSDPGRIGLSVGDVTVRDIADLETSLCEDCVDIAVLTTPASVAQSIADRATASGVQAVLKVLEEMHIPIDYVAGTSMGSIIGGLYASGMSPQEIELVKSGLIDGLAGKKNVYVTHPLSTTAGCTLSRTIEVPAGKKTTLHLVVGHHPEGDWTLIVRANGKRFHAST